MKYTDPEVAFIVGHLPDDSDKLYGWGPEKVLEMLDEYDGSLNWIMWRFWYERWVKTFEFIDIAEAGTTRALERIHLHCKDMLDYWQDKIDKDARKFGMTFGVIARPTECCDDDRRSTI